MSRSFIYARVSTTDQNTGNQVREIESAGFAVDKRRIVTESISGSVAACARPTVDRLAADDVRVHCLALGGVDLTSAAGKMTMGVLTVVAEFERDLLIERTHAGIARARAEGRAMGRPPALTKAQQIEALQRLAAGASVSQLARDYATTRQSIIRVRQKAVGN